MRCKTKLRHGTAQEGIPYLKGENANLQEVVETISNENSYGYEILQEHTILNASIQAAACKHACMSEVECQ